MASATIALLQLTSAGVDEGRARFRGERPCRAAADLGADVALFPEMWQIGYSSCPTDAHGPAQRESRAVSENGAFVGHLRELVPRSVPEDEADTQREVYAELFEPHLRRPVTVAGVFFTRIDFTALPLVSPWFAVNRQRLFWYVPQAGSLGSGSIAVDVDEMSS